MSPVELLVQLSKSPVSLLPTVTDPPSKQASQLLVPNAEFDAQLTLLFSPSVLLIAVDPDGAAVSWGIAAVVAVGATVEVGITDADALAAGVAGTTGAGVSPDAANATVVESPTMRRSERAFCIGVKIRM